MSATGIIKTGIILAGTLGLILWNKKTRETIKHIPENVTRSKKEKQGKKFDPAKFNFC